MTYSEAIEWLYGTQLFGIKLGLDPTRRLLETLDAWPRPGVPVFHVAGTNGKGSVCAFLESLSRAHGLRTGLFTSPHLIRFNERITLDGQQITDEEVARDLTHLRELVADWDPHPTFFELTTALGLRFFARHNAEVIVLETGMGGRLDATNAVPPSVSVLTHVDMDHQKWLGDTIEKIAAEKAGILKRDIPAISGRQDPRVAEVFQQHAERAGAPLKVVEGEEPGPLGLVGSHQAHNAAIARAAWEAGGVPVREDALRRGLADAFIAGRFQRLRDGAYVLDGAHNPAAVARLAQTWREEYGEIRPIIIYGALKDKDLEPMIRTLSEVAAAFVPVEVHSGRTLSRQELARHLEKIVPGRVVKTSEPLAQVLEDVREGKAWPPLRKLRLPDRINPAAPVFVTGSFFLVGEALALLQDSPEILRKTEQ